jgi:hypothetical protein
VVAYDDDGNELARRTITVNSESKDPMYSTMQFSILLKHYLLGVLSALAMSIGMGLTISIAGILSIAVNKKAGSFLDKKGYILEIIGAILIFCLGLFLWFASNSHLAQHKII